MDFSEVEVQEETPVGLEQSSRFDKARL